MKPKIIFQCIFTTFSLKLLFVHPLSKGLFKNKNRAVLMDRFLKEKIVLYNNNENNNNNNFLWKFFLIILKTHCLHNHSIICNSLGRGMLEIVISSNRFVEKVLTSMRKKLVWNTHCKLYFKLIFGFYYIGRWDLPKKLRITLKGIN